VGHDSVAHRQPPKKNTRRQRAAGRQRTVTWREHGTSTRLTGPRAAVKENPTAKTYTTAPPACASPSTQAAWTPSCSPPAWPTWTPPRIADGTLATAGRRRPGLAPAHGRRRHGPGGPGRVAARAAAALGRQEGVHRRGRRRARRPRAPGFHGRVAVTFFALPLAMRRARGIVLPILPARTSGFKSSLGCRWREASTHGD
jgi:hypothetical protein